MSLALSSSRSATSRAPFRWSGLRQLGTGAHRVAVPVAILAIWQGLASAGLIQTRLMPSPITVAESFWQLLVTGQLITNLLVSLVRVTVGLGIGVALGTIFALIAGLSRLGEDTVDAT